MRRLAFESPNFDETRLFSEPVQSLSMPQDSEDNDLFLTETDLQYGQEEKGNTTNQNMDNQSVSSFSNHIGNLFLCFSLPCVSNQRPIEEGDVIIVQYSGVCPTHARMTMSNNRNHNIDIPTYRENENLLVIVHMHSTFGVTPTIL